MNKHDPRFADFDAAFDAGKAGYDWREELKKAREADGKAAPPPELEIAKASDIKLKALQWLWPDRFALGKVGIIAGLPDEGKGQVGSFICTAVTTAGQWPCDEGTAPDGNVVLLSAEDDPGDTLVPRLLAAGCDISRVHIVKMVRTGDKRRMFSLVLEVLRQAVDKIGNVKLILIDPIAAYMGGGKVDSYRNTDVRSVLGPLVDFAAEFMIAVICVMHFNKKTDVTNALLRISDSLAYGAAARHVFAVVDDAENKRKVFVKAKNNLARHDIKALAYSFGVKMVGHDEDTGEQIWAPHVEWFPQHVDVTATEAMRAANEGGATSARDDAKELLKELLAAGPLAQAEIEDAAKGHGISWRTMRRAQKDLGVRPRKDGDDGAWRWHMPVIKGREGN
jgi:putative DNA primase/helicase